MITTFAIIANNMLISLYCERIERSVVKTPAPVSNGNTTGINVASFDPVGPPDLKISTSKIISNPIKKTTSEPAMAKEDMSK